MTCSSPISWEDLVAYWAGDLPAAETDRIDLHLIGCGSCSAESARVFAVAEAVRGFVPPVIDRAGVARLRARGLQIAENTFTPGLGETVVFGPGIELLVHRLTGFDLSAAQRVRVTVRILDTNEVLFEDPNAPFDVREGVLITCSRHYSRLPHAFFEVSATDAAGEEHVAVYKIPHVFPTG